MDANALSLLSVFEKKVRLEVPMFQRQYVWGRETQWEPLWEDIARKFNEYLDGRKDAPVHFLGAMVLDQKFTPTGHVERRQVIDGQQRLTTLQLFLAAFRNLCRECGCEPLADECETFTLNKGMMADPATEKFKVWPTAADRFQFQDVLNSPSRGELEKRYPLVKKKYARRYEPRPRMVEAYFYFDDVLRAFFVGHPDDPPAHSSRPLEERLDECLKALKSALKIVAIDLDQGDDAQVIFETLNARGEPLLPADLLRNYIFLRAARNKEDGDALYGKYWRPFDDSFWRAEVRQGRLSRPRSDLFMQHYLASQQGIEIPVKHLFVEYKYWINKHKPFDTVEAELAALADQGRNFRTLQQAPASHPASQLAEFLTAFDMSTAYPFLLAFMRREPNDLDWRDLTSLVESYILRRAVCGLTNKSYNRLFLGFAKALQREGATVATLRDALLGFRGESSEWPGDDKFATSWLSAHAYGSLGHPKLHYILNRLSQAMGDAKSEVVQVAEQLSVEHLMPQDWIEHWPLPSGANGMSGSELFGASDGDERAKATRFRNALVQTIGNLTLLTQPLNSAIRNKGWDVKRREISNFALLPISRHVLETVPWDEAAIVARGKQLLAYARRLWPR